MFGWIRMAATGLFLLTIIYICLSWYARSIRREKLEQQFDADTVDPVLRKRFINDGLKAYHVLLRRRLIWGVYIVPVAVVAAVIYVTNFM